jgi:hypothetical protein
MNSVNSASADSEFSRCKPESSCSHRSTVHAFPRHVLTTSAREDNVKIRFSVGTTTILWAFLALCSAPVAFSAPQASSRVLGTSSKVRLTNNDILGMTKAGLSAEIIVAKIETSACNFDTSPATLKNLKAASVTDVVILAMVKNPGQAELKQEAVAQQAQPGASTVQADAAQTPTSSEDRRVFVRGTTFSKLR